MQRFEEFLANTPLGSWAKSFVAFILGAAVVDWSSTGVISLDKWQTWVIAGLAATIPPVLAWLNPKAGRYGRSHGE